MTNSYKLKPSTCYFLQHSYLQFLFICIGVLTAYAQNNDKSFQQYEQPISGSDVSIAMTPINGGTFNMGTGDNTTKVNVNSFWMGTHEITWQQYNLFAKEVIGDVKNQMAAEAENLGITLDGISLPTQPYVDMSFGMGREGRPAISMTHYAAIMYAKWLSAQTGDFYRLPTEAEWEYACRAGSDTKHYNEGSLATLVEYEWYQKNSDGSYNKVAVKKPNAFGLYDMQGNIAEWTMDQYVVHYHQIIKVQADSKNTKIVDNPWFKPETLYPRAVRGGSWMEEAENVHCLRRRGSEKKWKMLDPQLPKSQWWHTSARFLGFRLVRPLETPPKEEIEQYWLKAMDEY